MESLVMIDLFGGIFEGRRVLVTGHTGFKGSWLAFWLINMGANVVGYALASTTNPSHFEILDLQMDSIIGDIRDPQSIQAVLDNFKPEIVFHLAAQPLVRLSYENPTETFQTNIIGTVNVLEACRHSDSVKAIVNITSDKCYENREWIWGYRENDAMGGYDPYSASKGCAELITSAYRNSFFNPDNYTSKHGILLASARAGNVIGGGDWARDRIITDMMQSASKGEPLRIRNPQATRPWQHVLEPLSGYLLIGQRLLEGDKTCAEAWNFGPHDDAGIPVLDVARDMQMNWDKINYRIDIDQNQPHEANLLRLDCSKACLRLKWRNVWNSSQTFRKTAQWYREYYEHGSITTKQQLANYITDATHAGLIWTKST